MFDTRALDKAWKWIQNSSNLSCAVVHNKKKILFLELIIVFMFLSYLYLPSGSAFQHG